MNAPAESLDAAASDGHPIGMSDPNRPANRLVHETSPYLLQHARNPVDWYPWGAEAIGRARAEDKPVLLSVGYSACHWCHVMERESFEDAATAALMNASFVCVKVDREERPDVDHRYQLALQLLGRNGGWPLTMFLTPALEPFFGGTYFPPERRYGMPAFREVLAGVAAAWTDKREDVDASSAELSAAVREADFSALEASGPLAGLVPAASTALLKRWDPVNGGFGSRPKFPNSLALELWLRHSVGEGGDAAAERVHHGLVRMVEGGVYDQLGGGFHRYSTDERWAVPHFEKMLYDNALLLRLLAAAHQRKPELRFVRAATETVEWLRRELTAPDGTFLSTQDADSEGEEGKFFVFTPAQLREVLGDDDARFAATCFGVTDDGNFEHGATVLHRSVDVRIAAERTGTDPALADARLQAIRSTLFEARRKRIAPATDDKVLAAWNGLALHGLVAAGLAFDRVDWVKAAQTASDGLQALLVRDGQLLRTARAGRAHTRAFAEDHAFWLEGEVALFAATVDERHLDRARWLAARACDRFVDEHTGAVFLSESAPDDPGALPERPVSSLDNAVPSAAASLAHGLLRLHALDGDPRWQRVGERIVASLAASAGRSPFGFPYLLGAVDAVERGLSTLVVTGAGESTQALLRAAHTTYHPNLLVLASGSRALPPALAALVDGKGDRPAAWLCHRGSCSLPIDDPDVLSERLAADARSRIGTG